MAAIWDVYTMHTNVYKMCSCIVHCPSSQGTLEGCTVYISPTVWFLEKWFSIESMTMMDTML